MAKMHKKVFVACLNGDNAIYSGQHMMQMIIVFQENKE